jgi:1-aminocyclopropane-1-carboxylate deaminase/D-cysteine desulfhydrase-like pyridoxal-dependent ACC family enzyme
MAAACARLGLECHLVLAAPDPRLGGAGRAKIVPLSARLSAHVHVVEPSGEAVASGMDRVIAGLEERGLTVYRAQVPHGDELRTVDLDRYALGYANMLVELAHQLDAAGEDIDEIWLCSTEATQAGVVLANAALGGPWRVAGITPGVVAGDEPLDVQADVAGIANGAARLLGLDVTIAPGDVENSAAHVGDGYGLLTTGGLAAVVQVASLEGVVLDPVYTGKAMHALVDRLAQPGGSGARVVFVHTGGIHLNFAYAEEMTAALARNGR